MNYKKIIKNQQIRFFILNIFSWIPAKVMLAMQYKIKTGNKLNFNNPTRFTEKIQHYKLYYRNRQMCMCVDKYNVRSFIISKDCGKYLNKLYGVYDNAEDIDFSVLPNKFVIKTTDGTGGENVFICKDKGSINIPSIVTKINSWRFKNISSIAHEWAYVGAKSSKIIIEEYLENVSDPTNSIEDYKFFCYKGLVKYLVVDVDRYIEHKRNFYDSKWNLLNVSSDCPMANRSLEKPSGFEEMIEVAEKLSSDFPFVRIDLYNISGKIFFGEMTFYPWSGYVKFVPDSFDYTLGESFNTIY